MPESIAILGGTGKEGRGLALRWAKAGRRVILGSRDPERAAAVAAEVASTAGGKVEGKGNREACADADLVVVATPFDGVAATIEACTAELSGKLVVSAVIPLLVAEGRFTIAPVTEGSAAQLASVLAPGARVGAAFHNVSHKLLADLQHAIDEDIPFACGDDDAVTLEGLCSDLGARGVHVGELHLAPYLEGYTAVLLSVNRRYRVQAGVRFTGLSLPGR
ncbi:MAG: NADPH-dependent F420 reductase [Candidatus Dormibacteria bacterium]